MTRNQITLKPICFNDLGKEIEMKTNKFALFTLAVLLILLSACAPQQKGPAKAELPVDKGYAEGKDIYFTHTEASNADTAQKMTTAMKSPVLYAPSLASVPKDALANVYSFTNGVAGASMSGLQPSVFDNPPGTEGYSPLRLLNMVTWTDNTKARELKSAAEILQAAQDGELTITPTPLVINMPFVVWDGGQR
jgi:hypothetical protein